MVGGEWLMGLFPTKYHNILGSFPSKKREEEVPLVSIQYFLDPPLLNCPWF